MADFNSSFLSGISGIDATDVLNESYKTAAKNAFKNFDNEMKQYENMTSPSINIDGSIRGFKDDINQINKDILTTYEKEKQLLEEQFKIRTKNHSVSKTYEQQLQNDKLKFYKDEINILHKDKYNKIREQEADIHAQILAQGGIANEHQLELLHNLKQQEVELNQQSLDSQITQYEQHLKEKLDAEEEAKKEAEEKDQERLNKKSEAWMKVIKRIFDEANKIFDIYVTDRVKEGFSNLSNAYEENFTAIAGYTGSDSRRGNHEFIKGVLQEVNANEYTKKGLNFSEEVFPEITNAVKQGFLGDEAQEIAISNALDKKIMPWLDTSSETWVQLQYNLTDERLQQIKGQQLLLQESREGNRLLQSGVISQIQDALLPSMDNLVANTTEVDDLNKDMQMQYLYLTEDMGYSKQEAMKYIQQEIDAYQNPYKSINSGNLATQLKALDHLNGTNYAGSFMSSLIGSGWTGAGVAGELGFIMGGETRTEKGIIANATAESGKEKYREIVGDGLTAEEFEKIYKDGLENLPEDRTATAAYDNEWENFWAASGFDANIIAHGSDLQQQILNAVIDIKNWLIGLAAQKVGDWIGNLITGGKGKTGDKSGGLLSKLLTGGKGFNGAITAGSNEGTVTGLFKGAGTGLKSGGLVGGLTQGGAGLSGGTLSGGAAAGLGAAGVMGGAAMIGGGINIATDTIKNWDTSSNTDKGVGIATSAGAIAGGGMLAAAGLGLASGPVGWVGLAVGAVALLGKAAYDSATKIGGASAEIEQAYNEEIEKFRQSNQEKITCLSEITQTLEDTATTEAEIEQQRTRLIESGLLTEKDAEKAKTANKEQLKELTKAYLKATIQMGGEVEAALQEYKNDSMKWGKEAWGNFEETVQMWNDSEGGRSNNDAGYIDAMNAVFGTMYNDLQAKINSGVELTGETKEIYKRLEKGLANDGTFDVGEINDVVDAGFWNSTFQASNVSPETMLKIKTQLGTLNTTASNELANSMTSQYEYYDPSKTSGDGINLLMSAAKATDKETAIEYLEEFKSAGYKLADYPKQRASLDKWSSSIDLNSYKIGSSYIPYDQIALIHAGERVMTAEQNKQYTDDLISGQSTSSIIQTGVQDLVNAIKTQTSEIINYLSTMNFSNSLALTQLNMNPSMGNTRVVL